MQPHMLNTKSGELEVVSDEVAAMADVVVCVDWTDPPLAPGNRRRLCTCCKHPLQVHPTSPPNVPVICVSCITMKLTDG